VFFLTNKHLLDDWGRASLGTGLLHRIPAPRRPPGGACAPQADFHGGFDEFSWDFHGVLRCFNGNQPPFRGNI